MIKTNESRENGKLAAKRLGYGYFIAAVVFLCNPLLNIVDILPDFFGYCFLIAGLSKWADLCPNVSEAVRGLSRLRWFMLIKMLAMLLVPLVDETYVLVFTFAFIVIESLYVFPAIGRIFDGLEYFGTRHDSRAVFFNLKNVRSLTYIFFLVRYVFLLLPELCELSSFEYSGYVTSGVQIDIASYKNLLIILNLIVSIAVGLLWLINTVPYINRIKRETAFLERVLSDYDAEITANTGIGISRSVRAAFTLVIAAAAFIPNLWIDGFNVVPSFVGGCFLTFGMYKLCKHNGTGKVLTAVPAVFTAISAASFAVNVKFALSYAVKDIEKDFAAYDLYNAGLILSVAEYAAMAAAGYFVIRECMKLTATHLGPDDSITDGRLYDIQRAHYRESRRALIAAAVGSVLVLIVNIAYILLRSVIAEGYYLVALGVSVVWVVCVANTLNHIYDQIEYKYM